MYEKKYSFLYLQNEGSLLNLVVKRSIINHNRQKNVMSCLGQKIYKKRGMDMHLIKDENGNVMPHTHGDAHTHQHEHNGEVHTHGCEHNHTCGSDCQNSSDCKNETVALLSYMLDHNEHHAAELDQMADNLAKLGMDTAAKQIKEAVSEFQKGNLRLGLALTTVKEELKEA